MEVLPKQGLLHLKCLHQHLSVFCGSAWWHQLNWVLQLKAKKNVFKSFKNLQVFLCTQTFSEAGKVGFICVAIPSI